MSNQMVLNRSVLQGVPDKLKMGREYALLGNYSTALKYFSTVLEQIDVYIKKLGHDLSVNDWVAAKNSLQEEYLIIYNLDSQLQKFSSHLSNPPPRPSSSSSAMNYVVQKSNSDDSIYSGDNDEKDPMVWDPPPPQPARRLAAKPNIPRKSSNDNFQVHGRDRKPALSSDRRNAAKQAGNQYSKQNNPRQAAANQQQQQQQPASRKRGAGDKASKDSTPDEIENYDDIPVPKKFVAQNPGDQELVDIISHDILQQDTGVRWQDIAGLDEAKHLLHEAVVLPMWMPWYFQGIRKPWSGVLLFGPPGTGKTMLAKAVATECGTTFFNVSLAAITSKWRGESEKFVRILFQMARFYAPSTIFIDEIDALCGQRDTGGEHEASRRVKTELLIQMDGIHNNYGSKKKQVESKNSEDEDKEDETDEEEEEEQNTTVLVLGATNHPWSLDDAMRRRLEKRIYIALPDYETRLSLLHLCFKKITVGEDVEFEKLATATEGYSNADITLFCRDAAMMGVRNLIADKDISALDRGVLRQRKSEVLRPVTMKDFETALAKISTSVGETQLNRYAEWMQEFGNK